MSSKTRAQTSRDANARPAIGGVLERLRLDIDVSKLPRDMEATWVREYTAGQPDDENVQRALEERGMKPATYDELNLPVPPVLPGRERETHGLIRRGGSILMIREREIARQERAELAEANEEILADATNAKEFKAAAARNGMETPADENRVNVHSASSRKGVQRFQE